METESAKTHNNPGLEDSPGQSPQKDQEMEHHRKAKRPRGWIQGPPGEGKHVAKFSGKPLCSSVTASPTGQPERVFPNE